MNNNDNYNHIIRPIARKKRTVIVYLGIFLQYLEIIGNKKRYTRILTKAMAKSTVQHKEGCTCSKSYTHHRSRTLVVNQRIILNQLLL